MPIRKISETSPNNIPTLQKYPGIQRAVADILQLSHNVDVSESDLVKINIKLTALISAIRKCLRTPE